MSTKQTVIEAALQLPEQDRLDIVQALHDSLEGPADPNAAEAWSAEIQRRLEAIDSGRAEMIPWEQARQQIVGGKSSDAAAG